MRITCVILATLICAVICLTGASEGCENAPAKAPPGLHQVAIYGTGLGTGSVTVNFPNGRIVALGSRYLPAHRGWSKVEATLTANEIADLRQLADWPTFRDLTPRLFWFEPHERGYDECYPDLQIAWEDKEAVYEVRVSNTLRGSTEEWVHTVYDRMCAVGNRLLELALQYSETPENVKEVPVDGDDWRLYEKELRRLTPKSKLQ